MLDWYFLRGCGIINFSKDHSLMKQNEEINTFLPLDLALKYFAPLIEKFHTISSKKWHCLYFRLLFGSIEIFKMK